MPFTVYEDEVSKEKEKTEDAHASHITDRARLNNRILDLRTAPSKAIFRINAGVCNLFRSFLDSQGFVEIHTPKLQGGATESGASVFQLDISADLLSLPRVHSWQNRYVSLRISRGL